VDVLVVDVLEVNVLEVDQMASFRYSKLFFGRLRHFNNV
jgi:hypothetical protein